MNGQRGRVRELLRRTLVGLLTAGLALLLLAPIAAASPIGDAENAMMAAWEKAGGETSPLGARKGDVYPVGDGFGLDFATGKMFFTPEAGANFLYGPVLDKYEAAGGPATSDIGFPTMSETPGLAGPDSRVATFSATDKPVIFWTPDHGAFVVRGVINAAWDKLGSSGGSLGVPVGDETYDADAVAQKFSGGSVSWNRKTKAFTAEPAALGEQLKGLQVAPDPSAAINMAWRAAGGAGGPLGARQGGQSPIGNVGVVQDFAGGRIYYSPGTGANAVETDILAKYESLGGAAGSGLGFPVANEGDGGLPASRIATFSAADKPVIFWTQQHGAFVISGAMKAAWDKLKGATGKLGAPLGDQAVDGDVTSQKFTGGKIAWSRSKNSYSTDPANLAPLLSGLQVSGEKPSADSAAPQHGNKLAFQWWWVGAGVGAVLLLGLLVLGLVIFARRRRRRAGALAYAPDRVTDEPLGGFESHESYDGERGYEAARDTQWAREDAEPSARHAPLAGARPAEQSSPEVGSTSKMNWLSRPDGDGVASATPFGGEPSAGWFGGELEREEEDPDTTPIGSEEEVRHRVLSERVRPEAEPPRGRSGRHEGGSRYADDAYANDELAPDDEFDLDDEPQDDYLEAVEAQPAPGRVASHLAGARVAGRHSAAPDADEEGVGFERPARPQVDGSGDVARPMIHLPLEDPYQIPDGYPIKASTRFGLYYTPSSALYHDTLAEIWLASEEVAQVNGFVRAD